MVMIVGLGMSSVFAQDKSNAQQDKQKQQNTKQQPQKQQQLSQQNLQGNQKASGHSQLYCDPINVSFAQVINSGHLKEINDQKNIYRLTISDVSPYILYYMKRPKRLSGQVSLKNFINAWQKGNNSFAKNPPNAILYPGMINQNANRSGQAFRFIVSKPQYKASESAMTYLLKPLSDSDLVVKNMDLNYSILFIH